MNSPPKNLLIFYLSFKAICVVGFDHRNPWQDGTLMTVMARRMEWQRALIQRPWRLWDTMVDGAVVCGCFLCFPQPLVERFEHNLLNSKNTRDGDSILILESYSHYSLPILIFLRVWNCSFRESLAHYPGILDGHSWNCASYITLDWIHPFETSKQPSNNPEISFIALRGS